MNKDLSSLLLVFNGENSILTREKPEMYQNALKDQWWNPTATNNKSWYDENSGEASESGEEAEGREQQNPENDCQGWQEDCQDEADVVLCTPHINIVTHLIKVKDKALTLERTALWWETDWRTPEKDISRVSFECVGSHLCLWEIRWKSFVDEIISWALTQPQIFAAVNSSSVKEFLYTLRKYYVWKNLVRY